MSYNLVAAYMAAEAAKAATTGDGYFLVGAARAGRTYRPGGTQKQGLATEKVRILPSLARIEAGANPFYQEVYMHLIDKPMGFRGEQEIYCPLKNDGQPCALCARESELVKQGHAIRDEVKKQYGEEAAKADKPSTELYKMANKFQPRRFYVVDVVERSKQLEGKKYWFIKEHYKKAGVWDKLYPQIDAFMKKGQDFSDVNIGFDLELTVQDFPNVSNTGTYRDVNSLMFSRDASPLATTEDEITRILGDGLEWRQLKKPLAVKGYLNPTQFIQETVAGRMPVWDDNYESGGKYKGAWLMTNADGTKFHALYKNSPEALASAQNQGTVPGLEVTQMGIPAPAAPVQAPVPAQPLAATQAAPRPVSPAPVENPGPASGTHSYQQGLDDLPF